MMSKSQREPEADPIPRTPAEVDRFLEHARWATCRKPVDDPGDEWAWRIIFEAQTEAASNPDPMLDEEPTVLFDNSTTVRDYKP